MNVYDFDNTIYAGDSTLDFYYYCLKKEPSILKVLPLQISAAIRFKFKKYTKTEFKEKFYCFLPLLKDPETLLENFWEIHYNKIKHFYLQQKLDNDVIISASPDFLLTPICKKLKIIHLIASKVDVSSGKYTGLNCYGKEKLKRFQEYFSTSEIDNFYSDSLSDTPIANCAKHAFLVKNNSIKKWKKEET